MTTAVTPLIRAKEASLILAISPRQLWALTHSQEIPAVRVGRSVRYDPSDLQAYIEARKNNRKAS